MKTWAKFMIFCLIPLFASNAYGGIGLTASESDPVVGAVSGIVKSDGAGNISASTNVTDVAHVKQVQTATALTADSATAALTAGVGTYKTANANPTAYTNFTGGSAWRKIWIFINDANTSIDATGSNIKLTSGTDTGTLAVGDKLFCIHDGTDWYCDLDSGAASTSNWVTTGTISGLVPSTTDNNGMSLSAAQQRGYTHWATGAGTWNLVTAVAGMSFCVYSTTAAAIVINPADADVITLNGTALAAGDSITSASAAGDFICLMSQSAGNWVTLGRSGTWTDTN